MENILTLNQSIFGTKTKERRISRRALKASVQELYVPQESDVITYDEGYDIDGGMSVSFYLTNQQAWDACASIYGDYQSLNKALIAGGMTVAGVIVSGVKSLALFAQVGAIPVIGWIALGLVAAAAATVATVLVGCLITGKGFEIKFSWTPKWYNPFKGLDLSIGWK